MTGLTSKIARQAAEHYARTGEYMSIPWQLPQELLRQKACYVSIIEQPGRYVVASFGNALPRTRTLGEEIVHNTVEAIVQSNVRMRPIDTASYLYSVAVLGPLERITAPEHLTPPMWGLYVRSEKNKSSLILPGRPGIESAEEQIATAIREAGIDAKNESMSMYRFSVTVYE
jgi:AMMECR1 domain-containing protein